MHCTIRHNKVLKTKKVYNRRTYGSIGGDHQHQDAAAKNGDSLHDVVDKVRLICMISRDFLSLIYTPWT